MREKKASLQWRFAFAIIVIAIMFVYLASGLVSLQLKNSDVYAEEAETISTKTIVLRGKRGNITDVNSVILAEDELIYNVTFYKDPSQTSKQQYHNFTRSILNTIEIIERNGGTMAIDFDIERNPETGEWQFNFGSGVSETVLATREFQWRSNNYLSAAKSSYDTAEKCLNALKKRFRLVNNESELAALQEEEGDRYIECFVVDEDTMRKVMAIYCEMQMNVFNSQPIVIAKNVSYETVIEVETRSVSLPGMEIAVGTKRVYPKSTLAAQVIGYIGAIPTQSKWAELRPKGYQYNDSIGRDGIESSMEDWLTPNTSQRSGKRVVERDLMSRIVRELDYIAPTDGNNVKLTIDATAQQVAENALAENVAEVRDRQESLMVKTSWLESNKSDIAIRNWTTYPLQLAEHGAMVILDMEGRVMSMANYPTYDLNALVSGGDEAIEILSDARNLMLNYCIGSRGTPGSIFKMVTAYGALAEGELKLDERITDMGYFMKYNSDKATAPKCWISESARSRHSNQTIVEGISNSCNYFFYEIGSRLGEERLYRYSALFGLTSKTGIDLPGELRSVVGSQNTLYDTTKDMSESSQDTSMPIIVFNAIKTHLKDCGASYNMSYDDDRLSTCVKRLMDMAINTAQTDWVPQIRTILMEELGMSKTMVYLSAVVSPTYNYLNEIKWGGSQTIMTAIGQSVTTLTPVAVARYVMAIANGGKLYNVSIIDSVISPDGEIVSQRTPQLISELEYADEYLPAIRRGMEGVVDDGGTATTYFRGWKYLDELSAKTGTAQTTRIDLENNAWFVCFAPKEEPEVAIVVFIPNGYSGASAYKAAKTWLTWYLDQTALRTQDYTIAIPNSLAP